MAEEQTQAQAQPSASEEQAAVTVEALSGHKEGTVLPSGEVVKGSYDADGNLVGWHKEPAAEEGQANG